MQSAPQEVITLKITLSRIEEWGPMNNGTEHTMCEMSYFFNHHFSRFLAFFLTFNRKKKVTAVHFTKEIT